MAVRSTTFWGYALDNAPLQALVCIYIYAAMTMLEGGFCLPRDEGIPTSWPHWTDDILVVPEPLLHIRVPTAVTQEYPNIPD